MVGPMAKCWVIFNLLSPIWHPGRSRVEIQQALALPRKVLKLEFDPQAELGSEVCGVTAKAE